MFIFSMANLPLHKEKRCTIPKYQLISDEFYKKTFIYQYRIKSNIYLETYNSACVHYIVM